MSYKFVSLCSTALVAALPAMAQQPEPAPRPGEETLINPVPTIEEELVYIRDRMAVQILRLDRAEQQIEAQQATIAAQQQLIEQFLSRLEAAGAELPSVAAAGAPARRYVVEDGDTLFAVARQNGLTLNALARANDLSPPYEIYPGQELAIPGAERSRVEVARVADATPMTHTEAEAQATIAAAPRDPAAEADPDTSTAPAPERVASAETPAERARNLALPREVGERPAPEDPPQVQLFADVGGVLTKRGALFVEPEIDFTTSSDNRFFFQGAEILDAILIGVIEATDTDRLALTERLGLRYGLTDRLEIDGRVAYVYRDDRIAGVAIDDSTEFVRDLEGSGLGDVELGLHYQLNDGVGLPFVIANMRAKAPTGRGPFEVERNTNGVEQELATGSGFWSLEPSVTFIHPVDPAVLFANFGYQINLEARPDASIGASTVRAFDPGEAIRANLGLGLALNDRLSVSFGYDQARFFRTSLLFEAADPAMGAPPGSTILVKARQPAVTVGSFNLGGSYYLNDRIRLHLNTAFGATDEAPDMRISLRAQVRLFE